MGIKVSAIMVLTKLKKENKFSFVISVIAIFQIFFLMACSKGETGKTPTTPIKVTITSILPSNAKAGELITVYGKNLLSDTAGFELTINEHKAIVSLYTNDSIKATVPLSAGSGKVKIKTNATSYIGPEFSYNYQVIVTTIAGNGLNGAADGIGANASFKCPWGITVDDNGDLYVADCYNRLIRKISGSTNAVSTLTIPQTINFYSPYNITLDKKSKSLYVTDFNTHLMKVDGQGNMSTIFEDAMPLAGIALSPDNHLYVGNNTTGYIYRIDTTGLNKTTFAIGVVTPRNIVFDKNNTMFIAAYGVYQMKSDGSSSIVVPQTSFHGWEIAIDNAGNIYEADHFNNVIRKIETNGNITIIAGSGNAVDEDGIGLQASFNGPQGITIDNAGNLYVTTYNYNNNTGNKVRKISFK